MAYYKATIDILIDAESEAEACDAISEGLRPMLREFCETQTSWIDWRYGESASYPVPHNGDGLNTLRLDKSQRQPICLTVGAAHTAAAKPKAGGKDKNHNRSDTTPLTKANENDKRV